MVLGDMRIWIAVAPRDDVYGPRKDAPQRGVRLLAGRDGADAPRGGFRVARRMERVRAPAHGLVPAKPGCARALPAGSVGQLRQVQERVPLRLEALRHP